MTTASPPQTEPQPSATTKPRRRWLQYSLRTLLIVFTVFAIWLGWMVNTANRQRRAVEAIEKAGGEVFYDYQWLVTGRFEDSEFKYPLFVSADQPSSYSWTIPFDLDAEPPGPDWLRGLLGVDFFCDVVGVQTGTLWFAGEQNIGNSFDRFVPVMTDELMLQLPHFSELRFLRIDKGGFTDRGLVHLQQLPQLQEVALLDSPFTDKGLHRLSHLRDLRVLLLNDSVHFTDAGLRHLHGLKKLRYVTATGTRVTKQGAKEFRTALPKCTFHHFATGAGTGPARK